MITVSDKPTRSDRPGYPYLARGNDSENIYLVVSKDRSVVLSKGSSGTIVAGSIVPGLEERMTPFQPGELITIRQV